MTEENQRLRDKLQSIERIVTTALASQPQGDEECGKHLRKAISDISEEIGLESDGNAAEMRKALESVYNWCVQKLGQSRIHLTIEGLLMIVRNALSSTARNCDRFSDGLTASETYENEGGEKDYLEFAKWLFANASEKGSRAMAEISDEKLEKLRRLYHTAVEFRRAQLRFCDQVSSTRTRELLECGESMHHVLVELNGGKDPVHFMSQASCICETAAMLAR